jgi:hypothetical protein
MTSSCDPNNAICLTFDVEWAADEIIADVLTELAARKLRATFFCTHPGIKVPGHERALHPNFRRNGDTFRDLRRAHGDDFETLDETRLFTAVMERTLAFCPEAVGVRTHSLFFELQLLPIFQDLGLRYDSSCLLPLQPHLRQHAAMWGITEIPIYYMDHFDLVNQATGFGLAGLKLDQPGLKVMNFHPTMLYINAPDDDYYQACKPDYGDPGALLARRHDGLGARNLFLDLLDEIARGQGTTQTLAEIAAI